MKSDEVWKPILGYEGLYEVSNKGRILSIRNNIILKPYRTGKGSGYLTVNLRDRESSRSAKLHRLVAEAFIPNPDNKPQVNHIDGNKKNNSVENLEWCTNKENCIHAAKNGLIATGEKRPNAKLTLPQVKEIRSLYKSGVRGFGFKSLARIYGVSDVTIRRILKGEKWKHEGS